MSQPRRGMWNSQWWRDARRRWDALPDKTWEEGTGFVDNPEKKGGRFGFPWIFNYLGKHGGHGDRFLHSVLEDRNRGRAGIKTALQQYHDRQPQQPTYGQIYGKPSPGRSAQQQHAATHGKAIRYPTGAASALKTSTAEKPKTKPEVAPSGPMKIGGTKKKTTSSATMTSPLNL